MRVSELARELKVKPSAILEVLPELGISDKKTYSSGLDDSLVLDLRRLFGGDGEASVSIIVQAKLLPSQVRPETPGVSPKEPARFRAMPDRQNKVDNLFAGHLPLGPPTKRIGAKGIARAWALATGKGHSGPADENTDITQLSELENYWVERRRDGSRDYSQFRETGKFGSHPLYDDCGDESAP